MDLELSAGNSTNTNMMLSDRAQPKPTVLDNGYITQWIQEHEQLEVTTFEHSESGTLDIGQDIDLDNNVFSTVNNECYYYNKISTMEILMQRINYR